MNIDSAATRPVSLRRGLSTKNAPLRWRTGNKPKINFRIKSIPPHLPEILFSSFLNTSGAELFIAG
ncbi:hypothetical protein N9Z43_08790, partial [Akkermansiaceae bacterium]|nr:hypothetical protein [Akkermansiaceae bacterium]